MMKILYDANVVVDIFGKSEDFFHSYISYDVALTKGFVQYATVSSVSDIVYVLAARKYLSKRQARSSIAGLMEMFDLLDALPADCKRANESDMDDFEDALIAYAAERNGIDFIITRNKKDFLKSPVPALTPKEFVAIYKPECLEYEMVDS